jgi:hypothetical protein
MDWKPLEIFPTDPNIPSVAGMTTRHASRLCAFVQGMYRQRRLLVIVRGANPASLQHHGRRNHFAKPVPPPHVPEGAPRKSGERGRFKEDGKQYFSDYDLQGVYERRHTGDFVRFHVSSGQGDRSPPEANPFLAAINNFVCPGEWMFQHGPNDDYFTAGPVGPVPGREPEEGEAYLVFEPSGMMYLLRDTRTLQEYYRSRRLSWRYRNRL